MELFSQYCPLAPAERVSSATVLRVRVEQAVHRDNLRLAFLTPSSAADHILRGPGGLRKTEGGPTSESARCSLKAACVCPGDHPSKDGLHSNQVVYRRSPTSFAPSVHRALEPAVHQAQHRDFRFFSASFRSIVPFALSELQPKVPLQEAHFLELLNLLWQPASRHCHDHCASLVVDRRCDRVRIRPTSAHLVPKAVPNAL